MSNKPFLSKQKRLILLLAYWIIGFIVTHIPLGDSGEVMVPNLDKVAHFVLYLFLSILMAYWLGIDRGLKGTLIRTALICLVYSALDEGGQTLIPSRIASLSDFAANCSGIAAGLTIYAVLRRTFYQQPGRYFTR